MLDMTTTRDDAAAMAAPELFFNRELSWLTFNERVLAEAGNTHYPLLERLRFLSISGSNLDEFMMVRAAGIAGQVRSGIEEISNDGKTPTQQLAMVRDAAAGLIDAQHDALVKITDELAREGIHIIDGRGLSRADGKWLSDWFNEYVLPVITPQAIDPAHPFPFIANQGMGILFSLVRTSDNAPITEMILIPPALPRFVRLPGESPRYLSIEARDTSRPILERLSFVPAVREVTWVLRP